MKKTAGQIARERADRMVPIIANKIVSGATPKSYKEIMKKHKVGAATARRARELAEEIVLDAKPKPVKFNPLWVAWV